MSFIGSRLEKSARSGLATLPLKATTFQGAGCVLSNFFPCSITIFGRTFNSFEQAYQYKKALHFKDFGTAQKILKSNKASECKKLAKHLSHPSWDAIKVGCLEYIVREKLDQVSVYRQALLEAEDVIIETVPGDTFWSCGLPTHEAISRAPSQWPGKNVMGMIHMMLRDELTHQVPTSMAMPTPTTSSVSASQSVTPSVRSVASKSDTFSSRPPAISASRPSVVPSTSTRPSASKTVSSPIVKPPPLMSLPIKRPISLLQKPDVKTPGTPTDPPKKRPRNRPTFHCPLSDILLCNSPQQIVLNGT